MVLAHIPKPQPTAHDRKRYGQHHRPSKHYTKTYWPYLPMALIVVFGCIINFMWHPSSGVLGASTDLNTASLLQATNTDRLQHHAAALSLNTQLAAAAQAKASDMAVRNYWSHVTPNGTQPWQFITTAGYRYITAAENLAYGFDSGGATISGWMSSPEHRANMLNAAYQDVGFGVATSPNYQNSGEKTIVVAMYAAPVTAVLPAQTNLTPAASQGVSQADIMTGGNGALLLTTLILIIALAAVVVALKHRRAWRRTIRKGEAFVIKHPVLDTCIVLLAVVALTLSRTSGFIH